MIHGLNLYDHSRCLIAWSKIQIGGIPICTELWVGCNALRLSDQFKQGCTKWGTQAISKQYSVSSVGLKRTSPPQTKPNDPINCQISIFNWKLSNQYIGSLVFLAMDNDKRCQQNYMLCDIHSTSYQICTWLCCFAFCFVVVLSLVPSGLWFISSRVLINYKDAILSVYESSLWR